MRNERDPIEIEHCFKCGVPFGEGHMPDCKVGESNQPDKYEERPGPKTNRRFETSREPFDRKRMKALKEGFKQLKNEYDEVVAVTLFGSAVTGYATKESDLDSCIFIDPSKAYTRKPNMEVNTVHVESAEGTLLSSTGFDKETGTDYINAFQDAVVAANPEVTENFIEHAMVYAISKEIIDHHVDDFADFIRVALKYIQKQTERDDFIADGGDESTALKVPQLPQRKEIGSNISAMFYLQMGHGLDEYREHLVNKLVGMDEIGAQVWKGIIRIVEETEQYGALGTDKVYPRTLTEAKATYCRNSEPNEDERND